MFIKYFDKVILCPVLCKTHAFVDHVFGDTIGLGQGRREAREGHAPLLLPATDYFYNFLFIYTVSSLKGQSFFARASRSLVFRQCLSQNQCVRFFALQKWPGSWLGPAINQSRRRPSRGL